ncbi:MAG: hypothetical protein JNK72_15975 [Myxococcales bacterium]|nr:hypothetical protein [Myxococcales bacterium]
MRASSPRFGPFAPPLAEPLVSDPGATWVLPPRLPLDDAEARCRAEIQSGVTRPRDSHRADLEPCFLLWFPVWRVRATVTEGRAPEPRDGATPFGRFVADEAARAPRPFVRRAETVPIAARDGLAFAPALGALPLADEALVARVGQRLDPGVVIAPSRDRDEALAAAQEVLRGSPLGRLGAWSRGRNSAVSVDGAELVLVAMFIRRYRYTGEAHPEGVFEGHVVLSGHDGAVLDARHPGAVRAIAQRVSTLFRRR